jgi:hypothetical protein
MIERLKDIDRNPCSDVYSWCSEERSTAETRVAEKFLIDKEGRIQTTKMKNNTAHG